MVSLILRRRRWLIDREIQVGLGGRIALCVAAYFLLFCLAALLDPILTLLDSESPHPARAAASDQVVGFVRIALGALLLALACVMLHVMLMLHRFAGPVYRMRKCLESLKDRDLSTPMRLRDRDHLQSLAAGYNESLETVREDLKALRAEAVSLEDATDPGTPARSHATRVRAILDRYRLHPGDREGEEPAAEKAEAGNAV